MTPINIIPKPVKCVATSGVFTLTADTIVAAGTAAAVGQQLTAALAQATGFWPKVVATSTQDADTIRLRIDHSQTSRSADRPRRGGLPAERDAAAGHDPCA